MGYEINNELGKRYKGIKKREKLAEKMGGKEKLNVKKITKD